MKIFCVSIPDPLEGNCLYWCYTKISQEITLKEKAKLHQVNPELARLSEYQMKATRNGFVDFLNIHFTTDNG